MKINNRIALTICIAMFCIALTICNVSATLGTFQKSTCFQIRVPVNASATFANISTIAYPSGKIAYTNLALSSINGQTYNRTYCDTVQMGKYVYDYFTSVDTTTIPNDFDITADGKPYTSYPIVYLLITLGFIFLILGKYLGRIFKTSVWDTFAGILFLIAGILTLTQGFNYTDFSTLEGQALGTILLGLGMIITYYSNKEVFD